MGILLAFILGTIYVHSQRLHMNNIAMFISKNRLEQEHGMLNRLAVGLMNEGEQVTRVLPHFEGDTPPDFEKAVSLIPKFHTQFSLPFLQRNEIILTLSNALKKAKITSIVAFGHETLQLSIAVASILQVPIYQEIISMLEAKRVKKNTPVTRWIGATPSIERAITERVGEGRSALMPLGVATIGEHIASDCNPTTFIAILQASDDPKSTTKLLHALKAYPNTHIFLELDGKNDHKIWSAVEEANLLERTTCLQNIAALRSLIIETDLVILPSSQMPVRTVLLEAMACGVPVLANKIAGFDMLIDGETALIATGSWEGPLKTILGDHDLRSRLSLAATSLVATNYGSAAQINAFQAAVTPL
jgi:hypothetical protein